MLTGKEDPAIGLSAAAPILFDLAGNNVPSGWFSEPTDEMTLIKVCSQSGYRADPTVMKQLILCHVQTGSE